MTQIHPTAVVESGARLGENVFVGPFCLVGPNVELADGVRLESHVVVTGFTRIGPRTRIFPFASVGHQPQDLKYAGEESRLEIGADNVIREAVTINPGTRNGGMLTRIGDGCLFMANSHVAHDCLIGNHVILANSVPLAGHITVGDHAFVGGLAAVHQFVRIGAHAMIGGMSGVEQDVIPYGLVIGNRAHLQGLNIVGLKRRGFTHDQIHTLRRAYRSLFAQEGTLAERLADVAQMFADSPQVMDIVAFMQADSQRSVCMPRLDRAA
ncbi:acyl-ACP--UDP-N-acetylglucosamine O-acyltransferase [Zavarzinia sp. CC-PAN008]|uniref:acyl-ACP--UDP-N-acetylglucosamine O-acyltransferase n=1 Tax=Zavarzinia sp. CC-PAN008 TaxID=3243332 RepID=UPI003F749D23